MADPVNERIILAPAIRGARTIVAPFQVEILQGDHLVVKYLGSTILPQIPLQLQISFRQLANGEVNSSRYIVPVTPDGLIHTSTIVLGAGFLLSMSAHPLFTALQGSFWCQASITRTSGLEELYLMPLLQGYPTIAQVIAWPGSPLMAQGDGQWYPRRIPPPQIAGTEWSTTVPTYAQWQVTAAATILSTSATVADRQVRVEFRNNAGFGVFRTLFGPAQPASTARVYAWGIGTPHAPAFSNDTYVDALPNGNVLVNGDIVAVRAVNLQAGDTWSQTEISMLERLSFV